MKAATMSRWMGVTAMALLMGCDRAPSTQPPAPVHTAGTDAAEALGEPQDPRFIGRIWVAVSPRSARGTMKVFLPDRTLLLHSCSSGVRISRWGARDERIRWVEDTIPIEATLTLPTENELELQVAGGREVLTYVAADETYTCP